jgi:hypothetical protein
MIRLISVMASPIAVLFSITKGQGLGAHQTCQSLGLAAPKIRDLWKDAPVSKRNRRGNDVSIGASADAKQEAAFGRYNPPPVPEPERIMMQRPSRATAASARAWSES